MTDSFADFLLGSVVGVLCWFFGGLDGVMMVLIACAAVDYISGLGVAWVRHTISSRAGFNGILRKCFMFSFVGIAHIIDKHLLGDTSALKTAVCLFYIGNEGISIIENAEALHIPIPKFLHGRFLNFTESEDDSSKDSKDNKEPTHAK